MDETKDRTDAPEPVDANQGSLFEMAAFDAYEGDFAFDDEQPSQIADSAATVSAISDVSAAAATADSTQESHSSEVTQADPAEEADTLSMGETASEAKALSDEASMGLETPGDGDGQGHDMAIDLSEIAKIVPNKMAFKIGEVADITELKPYVLRYWESEFEALNPQKSAFNQRMYSKRDVETVLLIKKLLYEEKFSIAGAKRKLKELRRELKTEKQWLEINERFDQASDRVAELVEEIGNLRCLFT